MMKVKIIKQSIEFNYPKAPYTIPDPWIFEDKKEIELDCKGTGSDNDPIQIDYLCPIPKRTTFRNLTFYALIKDIKSKKLGIDKCKNLTFENCTFSMVRLASVKNVKFKNTIINRELRLNDCEKITFENCFIKDTILFKSNNNILKENYFVKIRDFMSKNNIYEKNEIKKLQTNVNEINFHQRNTLINNKFKRMKYKLKRLFYIGPKALIRSPMALFDIAVFILFLIVWDFFDNLESKGFNLGIWGLILKLFFPEYFLMMLLQIYVPEYYYKIKLRILSKR